MERKITVAVLGCGSRGYIFTRLLLAEAKYEVVALCDRNPQQLQKMHRMFGLADAADFTDTTAFLSEKRAELLIIATDDRFHVPQCVRALELGYDVLLEKPISDSREEVEQLLRTQEKTGGRVMVCHELRYAPAFQKCKELLDSGAIGRLYAINAQERPSYFHWAQAYVRGIGASLAEGHPVILAKCCHDLDLIQAYVGSECETVSSVGELQFFTPANAPEGAAEHCVDCKHMDSCPYSAKRIYVDGWKREKPTYSWPYSKVAIQNPTTEEALWEGITHGVYGRCAFRCKVEKTDHQMVQMHFKNGVNASLTMAFSSQAGRRMTFYGTHGEIILDERAEQIELMVFGEEKQIISVRALRVDGNNHGGGDEKLIRELYDILTGKEPLQTGLRESLESHLMGIAAEESRLNGGVLVRVHR